MRQCLHNHALLKLSLSLPPGRFDSLPTQTKRHARIIIPCHAARAPTTLPDVRRVRCRGPLLSRGHVSPDSELRDALPKGDPLDKMQKKIVSGERVRIEGRLTSLGLVSGRRLRAGECVLGPCTGTRGPRPCPRRASTGLQSGWEPPALLEILTGAEAEAGRPRRTGFAMGLRAGPPGEEAEDQQPHFRAVARRATSPALLSTLEFPRSHGLWDMPPLRIRSNFQTTYFFSLTSWL